MLRAALVAATVPGLMVLPPAAFVSGHQPEPIRPNVDTIALDEVLNGPDRTSAPAESADWTTPRVETDPFLVAGITWAEDRADAAVEIEIRTRSAGAWSEWSQLAVEIEHGPDPGSPEAEQARGGTEPLLVDRADAVQVRMDSADGTRPSDLKLSLIDPGHSDADSTVGQAGSAAVAAPARPEIYTRAQWGADESLREPGDPSYGQVLGAFVHHTAGTNTYSPADIPAIIRGIYAYHVTGRGWRDIGYNFLVDKWGRIWEGRYGGVDRAVVGAHTAGYNTNAFGTSALGTYTSTAPEAAMISAYQRLFAWKFWLHGVNPSVTVAYPGQQAQFPIAGHRNAAATECPGDLLYAQLGVIRTGTNTLLEDMPRDPAALTLTGPSSAYFGSTIRLDVAWSAGGWVTGRLNLQRWNDGRWEYLRRLNVTNGRASVSVVLDRTTTYRVAAVYAPGVQLTASSPQTVTALPRPSALRLAAPGATPAGSTVRVDAYWTAGSGLTGRVNLQRLQGSSWVYVRQITIVNGRGSTTITLSATTTLRAYVPSTAQVRGTTSRAITIVAT